MASNVIILRPVDAPLVEPIFKVSYLSRRVLVWIIDLTYDGEEEIENRTRILRDSWQYFALNFGVGILVSRHNQCPTIVAVRF